MILFQNSELVTKLFPSRIKFNNSNEASGIKPEYGNKFYNTPDSIYQGRLVGGVSSAIVPRNAVPGLNVLPNCVGYAYGRFNEIIAYYSGINMTQKDLLLVPRNAKWIYLDPNAHSGCKISGPQGIPKLGAMMVWLDNRSDGSEEGDARYPGHVAIVEKIISNTQIWTTDSALTSDSSQVSSNIFRYQKRDRGSNYSWNSNPNYTFLGFIYNPSVPDNVSDGTYTGGAVQYSDAQFISANSAPSSYMLPPSDYSGESLFTTEIVSTNITRDSIINVDREYNTVDSQSTNLLSYPSLVEAPFINVKIGEYTFGKYQEYTTADVTHKIYPNFINSINIVKTNGTVNMYTINMLYQIKTGDDPNFIDKILSSVGYGIIKISYGDYASPSFVYKEEEALITKVTSNVDFSNSNISYVIYCTSSAVSTLGTNYTFGAKTKTKPSDVIKNLLRQSDYYGLDKVFPGITGNNLDKNFSRFIATDDLAVDIPAKSYIDPISYINYLVSYMVPQSDSASSVTKSATYYMTIHDDTYADYSSTGGTYFKVTKVSSTYSQLPSFNTYSVDVGYPGGDNPGENLVMNFTITDDNSWSLLYDYSEKNQAAQEEYSYSINNQGQAIQSYSPNITLNAIHGKTTAAMKSWWTRMTEFPISATLVIKGLIRPAMLMTYLRVNTYFYGKKHVSSGLYIITKQEDKVDGQGYRTTLSLLRIAGVDEYIERKSYTASSEIITGVKSVEISIPENKVLTQIFGESVSVTPGKTKYIIPEGATYAVLADYVEPGGYDKFIKINGRKPQYYTNINEYPFTDESFRKQTFDGTTLNTFLTRDSEHKFKIVESAGPDAYTYDLDPIILDTQYVIGNLKQLGVADELTLWLVIQYGDQIYFHRYTCTQWDNYPGAVDGKPLDQISE